MNEDIDWDNGVLPESQQYSFVVPTVAIDPLHPVSELAALPRGCKVHTKRMCLAAAARRRNSCVVQQGAKVSDALMVLRHGAHVRRQMPRGDRERRCGAEGNRRVKQDNCSVRDSVGWSVCLDQQQEGRRQSDRSEARNVLSVAVLHCRRHCDSRQCFQARLGWDFRSGATLHRGHWLSALATKEMMYLLVRSWEGTEATLSAWNVTVPQRRFPWVQALHIDSGCFPRRR